MKLLWCQSAVVVAAPPRPILQVPLELPQVVQEQNDHEEDESTGGAAAAAATAAAPSAEPERREPDAPVVEPRLHLLCDQVSPKHRSEEITPQVSLEARVCSALNFGNETRFTKNKAGLRRMQMPCVTFN